MFLSEAAVGGPIALVEDGDEIYVDSVSRVIDFNVEESVLEERRKRWSPPAPKHKRGVLYRYARDVQGAEMGAYTD